MKSDDAQLYRPVKPAMNDMEFRNYLDSDGHMVKPEEFRLSIYQGGVEPSLRRVVWRHLLNIFPEDLSGRERFDYMKRKENEYYELRDNWKNLFTQRQVSDEAKHVASLVKKDVLRTDRTHKFYAGGDESKNLISLYNLLVTYALTHPEVSYCQGMSDIASPLLVVQKEEAQAYLCFCGLMSRLRSNFLYNGEAITTKLQHLSALVHFYDPEFHVYMKEHGAEDLFFCYRWLLLEMKREFPFDDALYMLEVMWSTLPPDPPEGGLRLKDLDYSPALLLAMSPHSPTVALKQTQYSHLLAKRRISFSSNKEKPGPISPKILVSPKFRDALLKEAEKESAKMLPAIQEVAKTSVLEKESESGNSQSQKSIDKESTSVNDENMKESGNEKDNIDNCGTEDMKESVKGAEETDKVSVDSETDSGRDSKDSKSEEEIFSREPKTDSGKFTCDSKSDKDTGCKDARSSHGKEDSPDKFESANTSIASSLSNSYSVERFPSLISGSLEDEKISSVDDELEVISSTEKIIEPSSDNHGDCESDEQSQFHLSLEKKESETLKKKTSVPQIKGSFFSGMKKILSSPKRRPGKATKVNGNANIVVDESADNKATRSQSMHSMSPGKSSAAKDIVKRNSCGVMIGVSPDGDSVEHTLFELNLATSQNGEKMDRDSGNGSFTSSTNSGQMSQAKLKGSNQHDEKSDLKLDIHKADESVQEKNDKNRDMNKQRDYDLALRKLEQMKNVLNKIPDDKYPVFCENHFDVDNNNSNRSDEAKDDSAVSDCMEVVDNQEDEVLRLKQLPVPELFGYGNPFLMFICLTVLLQHREMVMKANMEYDELAMYFDKMVRKHNVHKVLNQARQLYTDYIRVQQSALSESKTEPDFSV